MIGDTPGNEESKFFSSDAAEF